MVFEHKYDVRIEDVDKNRLINNKALLSVMEDIACLHAASLGQGPMEITPNGFAWILLNWRLKVIKRVAFGESVTVRTWPRKFDRVCSYRDYEVVDKNGEVVALGSSRWFLMDLNSRRPLKLTEDFTKVYEPLTEKLALDIEDKKLQEPEAHEHMKEYKIMRRDLDSNGHMHNINYLDVALETLPQEVFENIDFTSVAIEYKKEIVDSQKIDCYYFKTFDKHVVTIKTGDVVNAIIELG